MNKMRLLTIALAILIAPVVLFITGCDDDDEDSALDRDRTVLIG